MAETDTFRMCVCGPNLSFRLLLGYVWKTLFTTDTVHRPTDLSWTLPDIACGLNKRNYAHVYVFTVIELTHSNVVYLGTE